MGVIEQVEGAPRGVSFPASLMYVGYAAYRVADSRHELPRTLRPELASEALQVLASAPGVALRGTYDASGYRSDVHLLVWLAAPAPDLLQDAIASFGQTPVAQAFTPFFSAIGVHRPSEYTKSNTPAYYRGESARRYLCVHPLVYTPEWYLLDPQQRKRLVIEEQRFVRDHPDVRSNTVSAFGMGDHDWLLGFESDQLIKIVDLQRHLRAAELRRYVAATEPVITGVRKPLGEILATLP